MIKTIHSEYGKVIANALKSLRNEAGLTQRELAQRLNLAHALVANWELEERRVDLAEIFWICEACGADAPVEAAKLMTAFAELEASE